MIDQEQPSETPSDRPARSYRPCVYSYVLRACQVRLHVVVPLAPTRTERMRESDTRNGSNCDYTRKPHTDSFQNRPDTETNEN